MERTGARPGPLNFVEPPTIAPTLLMLFAATSIGGVQTFVSKYAISRGGTDIDWFFTVFALSALAPRVILGRFNDRFGMSRILTSALISLLVSQIMLALASICF